MLVGVAVVIPLALPIAGVVCWTIARAGSLGRGTANLPVDIEDAVCIKFNLTFVSATVFGFNFRPYSSGIWSYVIILKTRSVTGIVK